MNAVYDPETGEIPPNPHALMEQVIAKGDLAKLTQQERNHYYLAVCESLGLNALTKPFDYIVLNGRLVLYANKGCTEQLRLLRGVSVEDMSESERDGVFIVTVKVKDASGRCDMAKGAVTIANLKGDALANAIMKCETKAKRRATLSICGLGMLDESEIETIPNARPAPEMLPQQLPVDVRPLEKPVEAPQTRKAASRPRSTGNGALPSPTPPDAPAAPPQAMIDIPGSAPHAVQSIAVTDVIDVPTVEQTKDDYRTIEQAIDACDTAGEVDAILSSKDWDKLHRDIASVQPAAFTITVMKRLATRAERRKQQIEAEGYSQ